MTDAYDEYRATIERAIRGDATALGRIGVLMPRPSWWRRLQARLFPRSYRFWMQRQILDRIGH